MNKLICVVFFFIGVIFAQAQDESKQYIRQGLIRSQGGISPGIMLKNNISTISLYGTLEYYIADNISIRGDSYYFLKAKDSNGNNPFLFNHSIFSGASYHFKTKNHFDPYLFFEPGIAITKRNIDADFDAGQSFNPLISSGLGFNYYFQKWFHLFMEARYISGKHLSDAITPLSLNELRFAFGLGFNLNLIKPKK